ncbi:metallophosphoesterase [Brevibacillus sp. NPDC055896]
MRTIVVSDIHGYYDEFRNLLSSVQYNPLSDQLYLLGDYMDRGAKGREVLQYVHILSKHANTKVIGGNHDDMFLAWLDNKDYELSPYTNEKNGGTETILSFCPFFQPGVNDGEARKWILLHYTEEINFLRDLPDFIEDELHIFVHAGIDPSFTDWKETGKKDFRWIRNKFYDVPNPHRKTIVFGHTSCSVLRENEENFDVWFSERKIGIDGGAKFGGQLNALVIDDGKYSTVSVKVD